MVNAISSWHSIVSCRLLDRGDRTAKSKDTIPYLVKTRALRCHVALMRIAAALYSESVSSWLYMLFTETSAERTHNIQFFSHPTRKSDLMMRLFAALRSGTALSLPFILLTNSSVKRKQNKFLATRPEKENWWIMRSNATQTRKVRPATVHALHFYWHFLHSQRCSNK